MDTLTKESAMAVLTALPPLAHLKLEDMRMKDLRYRDHLIEIIAKDPGVAIVLQYPDGAESELHAGDKKIWEDGGRLGRLS